MKLGFKRLGEKHLTLEGYEAEIVGYEDSYNVDIKINDYIVTVQYGHLIRGKVRNPYHPSLFSVGFIGIGKYKTSENNKHTKIYITWRNMLERGHSEEYNQKYPSYKDVTVCEEWHNFQNFAQWFEDNYNPEVMQGWHLDKDILVKGNKIYSPETCCFVPNEINSFFVRGKSRRGDCLIGVSKGYGKFIASCNVNKKVKNLGYFESEPEAFYVYKNFKENLSKKLAEKYKDQITKEVYSVLIDYKVEIDD